MTTMPNTGKKINIPPELPALLKQFTKDAIRTQPGDLIEWSTLYFSALVQGQSLPVRDNLEKATAPSSMDLTPQALKAMHSQMGKNTKVTKGQITEVWKSLGLSQDLLKHIFTVGSFGAEIEWIQFFGLGCSYLGGTIKNAMVNACYILNTDNGCIPSNAAIPFDTFRYLYTYLAAVDGEVAQTQLDRAISQLESLSRNKNGMVKVTDFIDSRKVRLG